MSIIIEGMEMPKGRPVCIVIDAAGQARRYDLNNDRYADDELFEAVPVPPHGRLIDADAMFKDICDDINAMTAIGIVVDGQWLWDKLNDALENAPTIIEAEEGE